MLTPPSMWNKAMTSGRSSDWGSFDLRAFPDFSSGVLHRPSPFTALGTFRNFTGFPILPHWRAPDYYIGSRANYEGKAEPVYRLNQDARARWAIATCARTQSYGR
jgi:hypothetical protein